MKMWKQCNKCKVWAATVMDNEISSQSWKNLIVIMSNMNTWIFRVASAKVGDFHMK